MDIFSPSHLLIVLLIVVLIFGTKKLRSMGSDVGGAVKEFKKAMNDDDSKKTDPIQDAVDPSKMSAADATKSAGGDSRPRG